MTASASDRLFGYSHAFDHPVTIWVTVGCIAALAIVPLVITLLSRSNRVAPDRLARWWLRWRTWLFLTPLILGPILAGAAWTILGVGLLSLFCYREYSRATGLFREKALSLTVVLGIVLLTFAAFDNWYRLFVALTPLTISLTLTVAIFADRPQGYIQRTALAVLGFVLLGSGLGHLGYLANDANYRPLVLLVLVANEMNDVFSYLAGQSFGHQAICPATHPRKTVAGAVGGLLLTTLLVMLLGRFVFRDTLLASPFHLVTLGVIISVVGQLGDLMFWSIKRDLHIEDFDTTIPGHGGLLDRFDSLVPIASAVFHYVNYFVGIGTDQPAKIWTTFG